MSTIYDGIEVGKKEKRKKPNSKLSDSVQFDTLWYICRSFGHFLDNRQQKGRKK